MRPNCFGGRPFVRGKIQRLKGSTDDAGGVLMPGTARETGVLDVGRGPGRFVLRDGIRDRSRAHENHVGDEDDDCQEPLRETRVQQTDRDDDVRYGT